MLRETLLIMFLAVALLGGCGESPDKEVPPALVPVGFRAGSFEGLEAGLPLPEPGAWFASDPATVVLPTAEEPAQPRIGFPSEGAQWLQVDAGLGGPWSPEDYLGEASHVRQDFRCGDQGFFLALDVAFVTWEIPGRETSNDFLAVDVLAEDRLVNLLTVDNATGDFPERTAGGKPSTRRISIVEDLRALLPGIEAQTELCLYVSAVNGGDAGMPSKVWVDHVRLLKEPPPAPFDCRIVKGADGKWRLRSGAGSDTGVRVQHLISKQISEPTGTGPVFGLAASLEVLQQTQVKVGNPPFNVLLDASGRYVSEPLDYPAGTRVDYVGILWNVQGSMVRQSTVRSVVLK